MVFCKRFQLIVSKGRLRNQYLAGLNAHICEGIQVIYRVTALIIMVLTSQVATAQQSVSPHASGASTVSPGQMIQVTLGLFFVSRGGGFHTLLVFPQPLSMEHREDASANQFARILNSAIKKKFKP